VKWIVLLIPWCLAGCGILDFGGNDQKKWEFRPSWSRGLPDIGPEDPKHPGYDANGNLIPSKEVAMTYKIPDISSGVAYVFDGGQGKTTPLLMAKVFEIKIPVLRWFTCDVGAGANYPCIFFGKRLTSIYEISIGATLGYDLDHRRNGDAEGWRGGIACLLIKF